MLDRLLLKINPVTENRHSTGTHPANMPRNSAASFCNIWQFLPKTKVNWQSWQNTSLLNSVQRLGETNIHQSLFLAFAHQLSSAQKLKLVYVQSVHYH